MGRSTHVCNPGPPGRATNTVVPRAPTSSCRPMAAVSDQVHTLCMPSPLRSTACLTPSETVERDARRVEERPGARSTCRSSTTPWPRSPAASPATSSRADLVSAGMVGPGPGRPLLRPRPGHRLRPLRLDPHPGRAARRPAQPGLGQPRGPGQGPQGRRGHGRADGHARAAPRPPPRSPSAPAWTAAWSTNVGRRRPPRRGPQLRRPARRRRRRGRAARATRLTPEAALLDRERKAYLIDAVAALPERLRRVVGRLLLRGAADAGPGRRARRLARAGSARCGPKRSTSSRRA